MTATVTMWLAEKPSPELAILINRISRASEISHLVIMPDAHVAEDVCVGAVTATKSYLIPSAVGSDIGCGMVAIRLQVAPDFVLERNVAAKVLWGITNVVPPMIRQSSEAPPLPDSLLHRPLSAPRTDCVHCE